MYISCTLSPWLRNLIADFTLKNCLFGSVKVTKNADPDKYKYRSYGKGFDPRSEFYLQMETWEKSHYFWSRYKLICAY